MCLPDGKSCGSTPFGNLGERNCSASFSHTFTRQATSMVLEYTDAPVNPDCGVGRQEVKVDLHPFRVHLEKATDLRCALGSRQTGPLVIPTKKRLKSRDIFTLWSGEIVVSPRIADIIESSTGTLLQPIWNSLRGADRRRLLSSHHSASGPSAPDLWRFAIRPNLAVIRSGKRPNTANVRSETEK